MHIVFELSEHTAKLSNDQHGAPHLDIDQFWEMKNVLSELHGMMSDVTSEVRIHPSLMGYLLTMPELKCFYVTESRKSQAIFGIETIFGIPLKPWRFAR